MSWVPYASLFVAALVTTLALTPLARKLAWRVGAVDYPNSRRVNKKPIPRMGGTAVFAGIIAAFVVQYLGTSYLGWPVVLSPSPHFTTMNYWCLVAGFVVIFATGVVDDIYQLSPRKKLVGQILAAAIVVAGGLVIGEIVNPLTEEALSMGWLAYPLTVAYLVAYANIINLIDGLDGLASGVVCISSLTMFVLSLMAGRLDAASLAIATCGSTLAFLRYNFHPASVFLGDSGALLLGFALGVTSLLSVTRIAGLTTIILPLVISGIPIIDTFSAIVRRARAHVSVGHADKGHIHHRLIDEGFDQRQAVLLIYAWTALLSVGSIIMTKVPVMPRIVIFVFLLATSAAIVMKLHLFTPVLLHYTDPKTGDDELVGPADPDFDAAQESFDEKSHHLLRHDR